MASGKPICANVKMNYCPIEKFKIGVAEEFKDSKGYADAILSFYKMDKDKYNTICANARNASENYDYKLLTARYVELINRI
jgi:glycosyltransferase involved in cell wall biosynthesis